MRTAAFCVENGDRLCRCHAGPRGRGDRQQPREPAMLLGLEARYTRPPRQTGDSATGDTRRPRQSCPAASAGPWLSALAHESSPPTAAFPTGWSAMMGSRSNDTTVEGTDSVLHNGRRPKFRVMLPDASSARSVLLAACTRPRIRPAAPASARSRPTRLAAAASAASRVRYIQSPPESAVAFGVAPWISKTESHRSAVASLRMTTSMFPSPLRSNAPWRVWMIGGAW